jgi:hypothetical protein
MFVSMVDSPSPSASTQGRRNCRLNAYIPAMHVFPWIHLTTTIYIVIMLLYVSKTQPQIIEMMFKFLFVGLQVGQEYGRGGSVCWISGYWYVHYLYLRG